MANVANDTPQSQNPDRPEMPHRPMTTRQSRRHWQFTVKVDADAGEEPAAADLFPIAMILAVVVMVIAAALIVMALKA